MDDAGRENLNSYGGNYVDRARVLVADSYLPHAHVEAVQSIAFFNTPKKRVGLYNGYVVSASSDGSLRIWSYSLGEKKKLKEISVLRAPSEATALCFAEVQRCSAPRSTPMILAGTSDGAVESWRLISTTDAGHLTFDQESIPMCALSVENYGVEHATISSTGSLMISGASNGLVSVFARGGPGEAHLTTIKSFKAHTKRVNWTAMNARREDDSSVFAASASEDGTVRAYQLRRSRKFAEFSSAVPFGRNSFSGHKASVNTIAFGSLATDRSHVLNGMDSVSYRVLLGSASDDGTSRIWDVRESKLLATLEHGRTTVEWIAFDPTAQFVATASHDSLVRIWHSVSGRPLAILRGHEAGVCFLEWSRCGRFLASSAKDGTARIWNVEASDLPDAIRKGHHTIDGQNEHLTTALEQGSKWRCIAKLKMSPGSENAIILEVRFSPCGRALIASSMSGALALWDISTLLGGKTPKKKSVVRRIMSESPVNRATVKEEVTTAGVGHNSVKSRDSVKRGFVQMIDIDSGQESIVAVKKQKQSPIIDLENQTLDFTDKPSDSSDSALRAHPQNSQLNGHSQGLLLNGHQHPGGSSSKTPPNRETSDTKLVSNPEIPLLVSNRARRKCCADHDLDKLEAKLLFNFEFLCEAIGTDSLTLHQCMVLLQRTASPDIFQHCGIKEALQMGEKISQEGTFSKTLFTYSWRLIYSELSKPNKFCCPG